MSKLVLAAMQTAASMAADVGELRDWAREHDEIAGKMDPAHQEAMGHTLKLTKAKLEGKIPMTEYDRRNTFVLFKNDRKEEERHPDYTGSFTDADGNEYFCDAWVKEGKNGKFMSGRVKRKTGGKQTASAPAKSYSRDESMF